MAISNVMETVVRDVLFANKDKLYLTCTCERCLDDIMAHALNNLPPRYIVNQKHQPYVRALHETDRDASIEVLRVVTQSATIIKKSPHCENQK